MIIFSTFGLHFNEEIFILQQNFVADPGTGQTYRGPQRSHLEGPPDHEETSRDPLRELTRDAGRDVPPHWNSHNSQRTHPAAIRKFAATPVDKVRYFYIGQILSKS